LRDITLPEGPLTGGSMATESIRHFFRNLGDQPARPATEIRSKRWRTANARSFCSVNKDHKGGNKSGRSQVLIGSRAAPNRKENDETRKSRRDSARPQPRWP